MNKDIIEKAIKEAREKGRGKIISRDDIYNAIFKAGMEGEYRKWVKAFMEAGILIAGADTVDVVIDETKRAGIREVVEWIEEQGYETFRTGYYPSQEMWQAQKKVWGVK